ncbi:unnamed protein product [Peronospora farinosa]|uniref:glucan endo-1,3-beta-D-glucosidase n=1 Tax=Peronospora farinosa TaxID=134698 RepID=A0AAV0U0G9_9STRA|nr:unnamed protein product [Peronospora farinosa]CAI5729369.1 unnamed protein product [Peronospora farinosa]
MKLYGIFLIAAAMVSAVSAEICMSAPDSPETQTPETQHPETQTEVPATDSPVKTQDDSMKQSFKANDADTSVLGADDATQQVTQQEPISGAIQTLAGNVVSSYSYTGVNCGGPGSYDQVTNIGSCSKTTVKTTSPVSPLDTGVTLAFRGCMTIFNIAVFDGNKGSWSKVSSYEKGGAATNMVFLNNENVDYSGATSPEGFCKADGTGVANESTPFGGTLAEATKHGGTSILASQATGTEVHIMTEKRCGVDVECEGAYDKDGTAFQGWTGGKKIFLTKVSMGNCRAPNVPAIWMLPDQATHSGQYSCNCRGMGPAGGCGELDIAEVLEKDTSFISTHYYFYDGTYNPGNDQFGKRPVDGPTTYVTIIDEDYGVKVLEIGADDFDFSCGAISDDVVKQWEAAK